jgi:hypothetical protein
MASGAARDGSAVRAARAEETYPARSGFFELVPWASRKQDEASSEHAIPIIDIVRMAILSFRQRRRRKGASSSVREGRRSNRRATLCVLSSPCGMPKAPSTEPK